MIAGHRLTALIPVRGGSKGLPGKNLLKLGKLTLLERAIKLAQNEPRIDDILVSTDCDDMHNIAQEYGVATPQKRPSHLAIDTARTISVVEDLVETKVITGELLLLLQATTPLRTQADLTELLDLFERNFAETQKPEAYVSLCENRGEPPEKLQMIEDDNVISYMGTEQDRPRQSMSETYEVNGAFYLTPLAQLLEAQTFIPKGTHPFVMPQNRSTNLDTHEDWDILQAMLETGRWSFEEFED